MAFGPEAALRKGNMLPLAAGRVAGPPQISIASRPCIGIGARTRPHPVRRNHLHPVPTAPMKEEQTKPRKIPGARIKYIRRKPRIPAADVFAVAWFEVLHSNWLRNSAVKRVAYSFSRRLLVDEAQGVEVPVVVVPESAWSVGTARRLLLLHALGIVNGWMVDAGACFQQISNCGPLLLFRQRRLVVINAEVIKRFVWVDLPLGYRDANQRIQQALSARVQVRLVLHVAHAATTTPCWTTIADVEPISSIYSWIFPSFSGNHPASFGDLNCLHSAPGTVAASVRA